jgi:hypothetical protein
MKVRRAPALVGWGLVAVLVSGWLALVEVFWLPLRIGGLLVPLSIVGAVVGNLMLTAAAHRVSGSRVVALLPALVWGVVAVAAMMRRPEGGRPGHHRRRGHRHGQPRLPAARRDRRVVRGRPGPRRPAATAGQSPDGRRGPVGPSR